MTNLALRKEIAQSRFKRYEIAAQMGIAETSLSRLFRRELTDEQALEVRQAIKMLMATETRNDN